jgi:hypothetical protein
MSTVELDTGPPEPKKVTPRLDTEATRKTTIDGSAYIVRSEAVGKAAMLRRVVLCDTREPWPHPWASAALALGWALERAALETGDLVLASHPHGAVIERKTPGDLASCVGVGRERFERELARGNMQAALWSSSRAASLMW